MSRSAVVRNYAEALLELAAREGEEERYGEFLGEVASLYRNEPDVRRFLETPRVTLDEKKRAVREVYEDRTPELFVRFVLLTLDKGRQGLLPELDEAYRDLLDEREGRLHATVTLAEEASEDLREGIREGLSEAVGRDVVPHFRVDGGIIGGIVVRMDDQVMDGSIRRRLADLKRRMLEKETTASGTAVS